MRDFLQLVAVLIVAGVIGHFLPRPPKTEIPVTCTIQQVTHFIDEKDFGYVMCPGSQTSIHVALPAHVQPGEKLTCTQVREYLPLFSYHLDLTGDTPPVKGCGTKT